MAAFDYRAMDDDAIREYEDRIEHALELAESATPTDTIATGIFKDMLKELNKEINFRRERFLELCDTNDYSMWLAGRRGL